MTSENYISKEQNVENGDLRDNSPSGDNVAKLSSNRTKKIKKKGIVYLSTIPPFMNVTKITEIMSQFGKVGRVFLQPALHKTKNGKLKKKKNKKAIQFTEGWIEFLSKRVAKHVAATLNNTRIGDHKKSRYYDHLWNMKYLPRFKWVHLSERLEYERAVFKQRMRAEIAQAKKEASHFAHTVDQHEHYKNKLKKQKLLPNESNSTNILLSQYKQRETDAEIRSKKKKVNEDPESRTVFLKSLFGK